MSTASTTPARAGAVPGQIDIWYFVLVEVLVFSSYFVSYMVYRCWETPRFLQSQAQLSQDFGAINTVILLSSSWLVARAVSAARQHQYEKAQKQVAGTIACGALFLGLKLFEWSMEIGAGFTLSSSRFFSFYYFLTGIHVLHVLIGFAFLGVAIYQLRSPRRCAMPVIESAAIYWHMVDFLWVMIFALLYVMI